MPHPLRLILLALVIIIVVLYICAAFLAYLFSDRLIFLPPSPTYTMSDDITMIPTADGARIALLHLPNPDADYTILYSHGNANDLGGSRRMLERYRSWGYAVVGYDYHGYGVSEGTPSEANAYRDVDAACDFIINELGVAPERIIAVGHSLGGAVAIDLASRRTVGALMVENTFVTAFRVVTRVPIFPFDSFRSIDKINMVRCPVLIVHGTDDGNIPLWHGEKLYDAANEPKRLVTVEGAGHNDLYRFGERSIRVELERLVASIDADRAHSDSL